MSTYTSIEFSRDAGIARILLNRPDAANGLDVCMASELLHASTQCRADASIRAVILGARGKMFCAGGDLKSFAANESRIYQHLREITTALHAAISNFSRMRAPLIVAVNGTAAGAGFSLAMCGDLVLAASSAKFTMAYTAAGLVPDGSSSYFLPRIIGLRKTQELMLLNRRLSAEEALSWGLLTRVVDDAALESETDTLAQQLATGPTGSYGSVKRLLADSFSNTLETQMEHEAQAIGEAALSADGIEGVAAFFAKRSPRFSGG